MCPAPRCFDARGRQLGAQTNSKNLRLQARNPTRGEWARLRASFSDADLMSLDVMGPFKHADVSRATRSTWGQRVYNSGMSRSGRDSAIFLGFVLSTLAASVVFSVAGVAHADQTDGTSLSNGTGGDQSYYMQALPFGTSGTITSWTFETDQPTYWASTQYGAGFITLTQCDTINLAASINAEQTGSCTGRVRHQATSISVSGNFVTLTWSPGISINPGKYWILAYYGGNNTCPGGSTNCHFYGTVAGSGQGWSLIMSDGLTESYWTAAGSIAPTPPGTRITSLSPEDASTTASTAVDLTVGYYINSGANPAGYDTVGFTLYDIDRTYAQVAAGTTTATTNALSNFTTSVTLRSGGAYSLQAYLLNSSNGNMLFTDSQTAGAGSTGNSQFAVISNPLPGIIGTSTYAGTYSLATSTCSFTSVVGCFQNAIVWAFYPSQSMLTFVAGGGAAVKNKPPMGYLFVNIAAIQALNASGTPPVVLAAMAPITTYIFSPLDTGLASILFFVFGVWLFLRVRHIQL